MSRGKQASAFAAAIAVIAPLVGEKVMDVTVAVFTNDGLQPNEIIPLLGQLVGVALIIWILQSGILKIFSNLMRKIRRTDELNEKMQQLKAARETIKQGLEYLKSQEDEFNQHVYSARKKVTELRAFDRNFSTRRQKAANAVVALKKDYHSNIEILQTSVDKLYKDMSTAEQILLEADEWARKVGPKYYKSSS